jgi:hypothetical protein
MSYELARKNVPGSPFSIRAITYIVSDQYHLMTLPNRLGFTLLSVMIDPEQRVLGCRAEKLSHHLASRRKPFRHRFRKR